MGLRPLVRRHNLMNESQSSSPPTPQEIATVGGGCFWCLEAAFAQLKGIKKVEPGFSGGLIQNPTYKKVCTGTTDHAETVQITYDPTIISFEKLLDVFFSIHDPTTLNRQGTDVGTQYRSVIFYHTVEQRRIAEEKIRELEKGGTWDNPIATEIKPLKGFYHAEKYHQQYYTQNSAKPYCRIVIAPKLSKLRKE